VSDCRRIWFRLRCQSWRRTDENCRLFRASGSALWRRF